MERMSLLSQLIAGAIMLGWICAGGAVAGQYGLIAGAFVGLLLIATLWQLRVLNPPKDDQ